MVRHPGSDRDALKRRNMVKVKKIVKYIFLLLLVFLAAVLVAHGIGKAVNSMTPNGGINESMYVDINGTKQWINIYGEDINNPVLLYLHGGPGSATSDIDYAFTRKWADVYTVVTWDQRNCGKSYDKAQNDIVLTRDLFMEDGKQMTEFLLDYMEKYGYSMMVDGSDYNLLTTILFNPNYSIIDWVKYFQRDMSVYLDFFSSDELLSFSLKGRYDYEVPYYNINGNKDYQTNYKLAQEYFDNVNAPYKEMFMMEDTTHGLLESKSEYFSEILHRIAENEQ